MEVAVPASARNLRTFERSNFFAQRCHPDAKPAIHRASTPSKIARGARHLPLIVPDKRALESETLRKPRVTRCARVSSRSHDGAATFPDEIARAG
jgi:hypothetical protein